MDGTAPQAEEIEQALGYLRLLWGDDFMIGHDEHGYWAAPNGQIGHIMRAGGPDELGELMNDYAGTA
ncbi:MAG TPA: hypothetical protein VHZ03_06225 [Trebonia sp.]|jgi:hypothetical protein|nr:hypothetical protein [Trebonia sp.]